MRIDAKVIIWIPRRGNYKREDSVGKRLVKKHREGKNQVEKKGKCKERSKGDRVRRVTRKRRSLGLSMQHLW